jgi:hypothetical protein
MKAVGIKTPHTRRQAMKRTPAIALIALSCLGTAARVVAQEPAVEANVPFEFSVGGKLLPADSYIITEPTHGVVEIRGAVKGAKAQTTALQTNQQSGQDSKLVFQRYGDHYFLHEVLCPTTPTMSVAIPTSKAEKRLKMEAMVEDTKTVLVAMK